jgi:hypothetical protein
MFTYNPAYILSDVLERLRSALYVGNLSAQTAILTDVLVVVSLSALLFILLANLPKSGSSGCRAR